MTLSKSGIEYLDYMWSFYTGCLNWQNGVCGGGGREFNCWARTLTKRFASHYPKGFNPTYYPNRILDPFSLKKPSKIGVAWVGDLFGDWVDPERIIPVDLGQGTKDLVWPINSSLKKAVFSTIECCPQHKFLFLTKNPENLPKWSPFPDNCWVGVSATNTDDFLSATRHLNEIQASVRYLSIEPFLWWDDKGIKDLAVKALNYGFINWLIIGAQTKPYRPPAISDVEEIVRACDKAGVPVFLKDNLLELVNYDSPETAFAFNKDGYYRQEMPDDH